DGEDGHVEPGGDDRPDDRSDTRPGDRRDGQERGGRGGAQPGGEYYTEDGVVPSADRTAADPGGMVLIDDAVDLGGTTLIAGSTPAEAATGPKADAGVAATTPVVGEVTVAPADSFWSLAEAQLRTEWGRPPTDAEVAVQWQRLIAQNRDRLVAPGDPDLIHPGQVFASPAADPGADIQALSPGAGAPAEVAAPPLEDP